MTSKKILLSVLLLLIVAGVISASVVHPWWKAFAHPSSATAAANKKLPSAATEYAHILDRLRGADSSMDLSGTIRIYDGEKGDVLKETNPFSCFHYGNQYYLQLSYLRTYCDGNLVLQVDSIHKHMIVTKQGASNSPAPAPFGLPATILFSDTAAFRLSGTVQEQNGERILTLHCDYNPEIKVLRLFYDTLDYRVHRSEIEWWKDRMGRDTASTNIWLAKVGYQYQSVNKPDISNNIRSFISIGKKEITPTALYHDYDLKVKL